MAQFTIPLLKYTATEEQRTAFSYKDSRIQILEEFVLTKQFIINSLPPPNLRQQVRQVVRTFIQC